MNTTENPKYTPGPWKVHVNYISMTGCNAGRDIGPYQLAVARAIGDFETDVPTEETEANARLIAAAPELLAALRNMLGGYRHAHGMPDGFVIGNVDIEKNAVDAIAKAEARS